MWHLTCSDTLTESAHAVLWFEAKDRITLTHLHTVAEQAAAKTSLRVA